MRANTARARLVSGMPASEADITDLSHDGRFALLLRGPRGRREAVVRRTADSATTFAMPVADGDPWIGRFSPDGRTAWLRSNAAREYAALFAVALDADGRSRGASVVAERDGCDLELSYGDGAVAAPRGLGTVAAFPSYVLHRVSPVSRGTRKSLVAWVSGPAFR